MSLPETVALGATSRIAILILSVPLLGLCLAWTFLSMRAVMDVGGSCADGGPYVSAQPCPGGAGLIGIAIPVMLLAAFAGSFAGASLSAPNLVVPMWAVLFGSLGWNFLDYGFTDGPIWGWIVCGVVFELMALPALVVMVVGLRAAIAPPRGLSTSSPLSQPASPSPWADGLTWWAAYPVLGAVGAVVGIVTFHALA